MSDTPDWAKFEISDIEADMGAVATGDAVPWGPLPEVAFTVKVSGAEFNELWRRIEYARLMDEVRAALEREDWAR
jgi:hypothetical protein